MPTGSYGGPSPRRSVAAARTENCKRLLKASFSCVSQKAHGEIVVFENPTGQGRFLVAWRRDRRFSKSITRLSWYDDGQSALSTALALSCGYIPPAVSRGRLLRDTQRTSVYLWERAFAVDRAMSLSEMKNEASTMCRLFRIAEVAIRCGHRNLATNSYFSGARGIVISPRMMDSTTFRHEFAHYLARKTGVKEPAHGPVFAAALAATHALVGGASPQDIVRKASDFDVEINEPLLAALLRHAGKEGAAAMA